MLINTNFSSKQLRILLRSRRLALTRYQQQQSAKQLARLFCRSPLYKKSQRIGFYQACNGEINPRYLLQMAHAQGKTCYLPVLRRFPKFELGFVKVSPNSRLHKHRFGMKEPKNGRMLFIHQLDMVCMPLVGFDENCNRIGLGGGFYDRSLASHKNPQLIKLGLAHDCQQVDKICRQDWDIAMDAVLTPTQLLKNQLRKSRIGQPALCA